jgi:hypothetical protein
MLYKKKVDSKTYLLQFSKRNGIASWRVIKTACRTGARNAMAWMWDVMEVGTVNPTQHLNVKDWTKACHNQIVELMCVSARSDGRKDSNGGCVEQVEICRNVCYFLIPSDVLLGPE